MVDQLRVLTCIELFLYSKFYSKHPVFTFCFENSQLFSSLETILKCCISDDALNTDLSSFKLVQREAINSCSKNKWSSFISILALSTVINRSIETFYPDFGAQKYKFLFNQVINPRVLNNNFSSDCVSILFSRADNVMKEFKPNHFVPLIFIPIVNKHKIIKHQLSDLSLNNRPTKKMKKSKHIIQPQSASFIKSNNYKILYPTSNSLTFPETAKTFPVSTITKYTPSLTSSSSSVSTVPSTCNTIKEDIISNKNKSVCVSKLSTRGTILGFFSKFPKIKPEPLKPETPISVGESLSSSSKIILLPSPVLPVVDYSSNSISKYDVGSYKHKGKKCSDSDLLDLINNVFIPDNDFVFPKDAKTKRSFCHSWLKRFSWLSYSPSEDGAYCLQCTLLQHMVPTSNKRATNLISTPMKHWNDSMSTFTRHNNKSQLHKDTSFILDSLRNTHYGKSKSIDEILSESFSKRVQANRAFLIPIIDTIVLCGRLAIALRGRRETLDFFEPGKYSPYSIGNFMELLNFRIMAGDSALLNHLKTCAKNASYTSPVIQNELIACCGAFIRDKIVLEVKKAKIFTIICDEACDSSTKEQMSLVLRFVDEEFNVREDFIAFIHCSEGLNGAALAKVILDTLDDYGLNIKNCRGQGYDGAGSVAGKVNGCSAHILRLNHLALYTHCFSHRLNLVVCKSCSVYNVKKVMDLIKDMSYFFNLSETRQIVLEKNIKEILPESTKSRLLDVCRTRWVERIVGMGNFQDLFPAIVQTFVEMSENVNRKSNDQTQSRAHSHRNAVERFDFIVGMVFTRRVFDLTMDVTKLLQAKGNDILDAIHLVETLKLHFSAIRSNIDQYHSKWYDEAKEVAKSVDVIECAPRVAGRQTHRPNHPSSDTSDYFKRSLTIPFIDHVCTELDSRFNTSLTAYHGLVLIPSKMLHLISKEKEGLCKAPWKEQFKTFFNFYLEDFPNPLAIDGELDLWQQFWENSNKCLPNSVSKTLKEMPHSFHKDDGIFVNIEVALRILATLPVTSCECERSFSALRRLKNYNRSTMGGERLNGLALMHVHLEVKIDKEDIINRFSALGSRRIAFLDREYSGTR